MGFEYKVMLTITLILMIIFWVSTIHYLINIYHEYRDGKQLLKYLDNAERACKERFNNDKQR